MSLRPCLLTSFGAKALWLILLLSAPLAGETYYIDPVNGNDQSNTGLSVASAWKSFRNLTSYYAPPTPPLARPLKAGDTVFVLNGSIGEICRPGDDHGPPNVSGRPAVIYLRGVHGTQASPITIQAYPGHHPRLDANYLGEGLCIEQSSWLTFSGIDITRGFSQREGGNIRLNEANHITIHDSTVNHADGEDNANMSGLNCSGSSDIQISNCTFHDNYDRAGADTGGISTFNSTNMVFFGGSNITVRDCLIYQTPAPRADTNSGGGIKYKHSTGNPTGFFYVYNNVFRNCKFFSIQTGSANSHIHHNIIIGGNVPLDSLDCGGPTHQINQIFEFNTIYNPVYERDQGVSESGLKYEPTIAWRNANFPNDPKNIVFRRNIVIHSGRYSEEHGTLTINPYIGDDIYNIAIPELFISNNLYFNSAGHPLSFSAAAAGNNLGGRYTWDAWRNLTWRNPGTGATRPLNFDQGSLNADPQLVSIDLNLARYDLGSSAFRPAAGSPAVHMGAYASAATLTLVSPNGAEAWRRNESRAITWTATGVSENLTIELMQGPTLLGVIATGLAPASGSFTWTVGRLADGTFRSGTNLKVRIRTASGQVMATKNL